jgi:hypothetical protein
MTPEPVRTGVRTGVRIGVRTGVRMALGRKPGEAACSLASGHSRSADFYSPVGEQS